MNRQFPHLIEVTMAAVIACAATSQAPASQAPQVPGFPQSAGVQTKTHNFTVENLRKAHEMGFRVVRRAFYWSGVEKEKGVYDFSKWDKQMEEADRLGITIVGVLFGNNKLHEDDGRGGVQTEEGRQGFAKFAAATVERYKDHNILWEVWNEPNVRTFWRKDGKHNSDEFAKEYTDLVKAIMKEVLKVDPDAFVMAGSVSNYWKPSYQWTESCFKYGILDSGIKGWSVHPYGLKTPEEFAVGHTITRDLLKKYGHPEMAMLNTERGFAIKELKNNEGWSGGNKEKVFEYQAWHFVRQYMADQMHNVVATVWYEWDGKDAWTGSAFALFNPEPRPIEKAARVMLEQLNGYDYVQRIDTGYAHDYVVLYQNEAGEKQLVAWTAPLPGDPPEGAFPHKVQIDLGMTGAFKTIDLFNESTSTGEDVKQFTLDVSGAPQYVKVPAEAKVTAKSLEPYRAPVEAAKAPPAEAIDLKLFEADDQWQFVQNTGEGLFEVVPAAAKPSGVLHYNFQKSDAQGTPYVLATTDVNIEAGATKVMIYARSDTRQPLTFRVIDSTGQTHQFKKRIDGIEKWELIEIPLDRKLEHWGGAKDGKVHWPIKTLVFSVPQPSPDKKMGKVEYSDVHVVTGGEAGPAPAKPAAQLEAPIDMKLFASSDRWTFQPNTGAGSFEIAQADGQAVGVINYDFSEAIGQGTPYVLTSAAVKISGGKAVTLKARSNVAQSLTFRLVDDSGQTHQYKSKIKGTGKWEPIAIPMDRKLEHWGGAKDGKIHWPIKSLVFSVPQPSEDHKTGKVEYVDVVVTPAE